MNSGYVITFHTHYEAMRCLRTLEKDETAQSGVIAVKLIPVPRELSSACGTAVKVTVKDGSTFDTSRFSGIEHDEVFSVDAGGKYSAVTIEYKTADMNGTSAEKNFSLIKSSSHSG